MSIYGVIIRDEQVNGSVLPRLLVMSIRTFYFIIVLKVCLLYICHCVVCTCVVLCACVCVCAFRGRMHCTEGAMQLRR